MYRKWLVGTLAVGVTLQVLVVPANPVFAQDCTISILESGIDYVATPNDDVVCLFGSSITLRTFAGDDTVIDHGINNVIYLGSGSDEYSGEDADKSSVFGEEGPDTITGTPGDDEIEGGEGSDRIYAGNGEDFLKGGGSEDTLSGGPGDDIMIGGEAIDVLLPGEGWNICDYNLGERVELACKYDDTPPKILDLQISPATIDVTDSPRDLQFRFRLEDESGIPTFTDSALSKTFLSARIVCSPNISDYEANWIEFFIETKDRIEDGSYLVSKTIPKGLIPGNYKCFAQATDNALNETLLKVKSVTEGKRAPIRWVYPTDDTGASFTVNRAGSNWIDQAPLLSDFQANALEFDSSVDRTFWIEATATELDADSDPAYAQIRCLNPANSRQIIQNDQVLITSEGRLRFDMVIHPNAVPGDYTCWWNSNQNTPNSELQAGVGKRRAYSPTGLTIKIRRSATGVFDDESPVVSSISMSTSVVDSSASDSEITFTFKVTDKTLVNYFYFHCARLVTGDYNYQTWGFGGYITNFKDKSTVSSKIKIPFGTRPGKYYCFYSTGDTLYNTVIDPNYIDSVGEINSGKYFTVIRPGKVKTSRLSDTSARLDWLAPSTGENEAVTSYQVEISRDNKVWKTLSQPGSKILGVNLIGLKASTKYFVRVIASYESGDTGIISGTFVTKIARPQPPSSLGISKKSGKLQLLWNKPKEVVTDYKVFYSRDLITWNLVSKPPSSSTVLTLTGLRPRSTYYFKVAAFNPTGQSLDSKILKFVTG